MGRQLNEFLNHYGPKMEDALLHGLPLSDTPGTESFNKAVYDAVFPSGKRMRPLFTLLAAKTVGIDPERAFPVACAIEYFHTCSLIFDDLPAMDNALERRHRQPIHRVFGEDVAILAALAFLNRGYALAGQVAFPEKQANRMSRLMHEITTCIGADGMIGGQVVDLRLRTDMSQGLKSVSYKKTTALTRLMLTAGAIVAGADDARTHILATFGEELGRAYQMLDDIVDEFEDYATGGANPADIDIHALWDEADEILITARDRLKKDLGDKDPTLLIELSETLFRKLRKKAAGRFVTDKWRYDAVIQDSPHLLPE